MPHYILAVVVGLCSVLMITKRNYIKPNSVENRIILTVVWVIHCVAAILLILWQMAILWFILAFYAIFCGSPLFGLSIKGDGKLSVSKKEKEFDEAC